MYNLCQLDVQNNQLEYQYKTYAKILAKVITEAKIKYDQGLVQNNANNPKKLWEIINSKIGKKKSYDTINYIKVDNDRISDKTDIANSMNKFFSEIG